MMAQTLRIGILCRLIVALILALCLVSVSKAPAVALSVDDYFTISYEVEFSKNVVYGNEVFYATVTAQATCTKDLPLAVSEAVVTGRVVAENEESGTKVVLNSSYTISISPFPSKEGEATQVSQSVALQFPDGSEAGGYNIAGELIEARVKAILWFTVTAYLPASQQMGSVTYLIDSGGGGGGDTAEPIPPGTTSTAGKINWQGIVLETIIAPSEDYRCSITLYEGTKALDKYGWPLKEISIVEMKYPPAPPEGCTFIGFAYNISPNGAVFVPPAILTLAYDEAQVPAGVNEENLVIATWDEATGEWVELEDSLVNPVTNTITVPVSHFTTFTVLAHTAPPALTISGLSISAAEVGVGQSVAIAVVVANSGNLEGSYEVALKINGEVEEVREVTLSGGASEVVTFNVIREAAGVYLVDVNSLLGSFVVKEEAPQALTTTLAAPEPTNWWLVGGIYAADIVLLIIILRFIRRWRQ